MRCGWKQQGLYALCNKRWRRVCAHLFEGNNLLGPVGRETRAKGATTYVHLLFFVCVQIRMRETRFRLKNNWLMTRPRARSLSLSLTRWGLARALRLRENVSLREPMNMTNIFIWIQQLRRRLRQFEPSARHLKKCTVHVHMRCSKCSYIAESSDVVFEKRKMCRQQCEHFGAGIYGRQAFPGLEFLIVAEFMFVAQTSSSSFHT